MSVVENVARANNRPMLMVFGGLAAIIMLAAVFLFAGLPVSVITPDAFRLLIILGALLVSLLVALRGSRITHDSHKLTLHSGFVLWAFLLATETFFARPNQGEDNALSGKFTLNAYGEAITWIAIGLALVLITLNRSEYVTKLFRGQYKYVSLFTVACVFSVAFAQEPLFSLAWAFKLVLVAMVLCLCITEIQTLPEMRTFLWLTFWVFVFLTVQPVIEGAMMGSVFSGTQFGGEINVEPGRFHGTAHPLIIGGRAGIVALFSLMFYVLERKKWLLILPACCAVVIALTGAKTAFIAAVISIMVFFMLRRKVGAALMAVAGMAIVALIIIETTAVGGYIKTYMSIDEGATLSGRTDLWSAAFPLILQRPILGHGYASSKFISGLIDLPWFAGHMHNGMMEALYNTGVIGLALIITINVLTFVNLRKIAKHAPNRQILLLTIGLLTVYIDIFLNALSEPWFGGQANAFFILFFALFGISEWLSRFVENRNRYYVEPAAKVVPVRTVSTASFLHR